MAEKAKFRLQLNLSFKLSPVDKPFLVLSWDIKEVIGSDPYFPWDSRPSNACSLSSEVSFQS